MKDIKESRVLPQLKMTQNADPIPHLIYCHFRLLFLGARFLFHTSFRVPYIPLFVGYSDGNLIRPRSTTSFCTSVSSILYLGLLP